MPTFPGIGRKRPQFNKGINLLLLDKENPRLPQEAQGQSETELLRILYKGFNLDELAESMAQNGYFDEEPLVGVPVNLPNNLENIDPNSDEFHSYIIRNDIQLIIVEGNRRLATAKILLDDSLRDDLKIKNWPKLSPEVINDLTLLPVIVYKKRSEVVPYLGVRHIIGIQKWDSYAKARYIAQMIEDGSNILRVAEQIGDKQGAIMRNYISYKMVEQVENEFDFNTANVKKDFSLLLLAIGQGNIKRFIGLPSRLSNTDLDSPVPEEKLENLKRLTTWIFGDEKRQPVIKESRDITNYLSHIVANEESVKYLDNTWDLIASFDRSDGEETMLLRYLSSANIKLEHALGVAHRHKTTEVIDHIERCDQTVEQLLKSVRNSSD